MTAKTIRSILQGRPFRPIELRTTEGTVYTVRHPESIAVLDGDLVVLRESDGAIAWFETAAVADMRRQGPRRERGVARR